MKNKQKKSKSIYFLFGLVFILTNTFLYLIIVSPSQHIVAGICWMWALFVFYLPFNLLSFEIFPAESAIWPRKILALLVGAIVYGIIFYSYNIYITKIKKSKSVLLYYLPFWIIIFVMVLMILYFCVLVF